MSEVYSVKVNQDSEGSFIEFVTDDVGLNIVNSGDYSGNMVVFKVKVNGEDALERLEDKEYIDVLL